MSGFRDGAAWYGQGMLAERRSNAPHDTLGNRIGRDIASIATTLPKTTHFTVIDPFAGSCNTLYWILRYVPNSQASPVSSTPGCTSCNMATTNRLADRHLPPDHVLIFFMRRRGAQPSTKSLG